MIELMSNRFYKDFAPTTARQVIGMEDGVAKLYDIATDNGLDLPTPLKRNVLFRSAYTLEYIYFNYPEHFTPFRERFYIDFCNCENPSAKRHFAKMMADILKHHSPTIEQTEAIAETSADWISNPKIKIAVKIWAMSILRILRPNISWVDEIWEDLEMSLQKISTPAIEVRRKRGWH